MPFPSPSLPPLVFVCLSLFVTVQGTPKGYSSSVNSHSCHFNNSRSTPFTTASGPVSHTETLECVNINNYITTTILWLMTTHLECMSIHLCVCVVCVCVRVDNLHVHTRLRFYAYIIIVCVFVWVYPYLPHLVSVQISTHCWRFVIIAFSLNPNTLYKSLVVQESLLCLLSVCVYSVHVIWLFPVFAVTSASAVHVKFCFYCYNTCIRVLDFINYMYNWAYMYFLRV